MWHSTHIQLDEDDELIASTGQPGYVGVQIHSARHSGPVTLTFGSFGELGGLVVLDKLVTALQECRLELAGRIDARTEAPTVELGERAKGSGR